MNIMAQACGIIILITLILFYRSQKKLHLKTELMYMVMLIISLLTHVLDVVSLYAIKYKDVLAPKLVESACKIYLISLVAVLVAVLIYISEEIYLNRKTFFRNVLSQMFLVVAGMVGIIALPIKIYSVGGVMYTYGASALMTYCVAFYCICMIASLTIYYRKRINMDRMIAVLLWMGLWCLAALVQFFVPRLLLVSFAVSIGMIILYIKLENPGMNIDRQSGVFNQNALIEYLKHKFSDNKKFALVFYQMDHTGNSLYGNRFNWEHLQETILAKDAIMFRKSEDAGVLIFPDIEKAQQWGKIFFDKIKREDQENYFYLRRALWVSIYDSSIFADADEILYYLRFIAVSHYLNGEQFGSAHVVAGEEEVRQMRHEKDAEKLIEQAMQEDRVEVYYQPIFSTEEERFSAAEALVRIRDTEGNIVSPAVFIPIAERTGKIIALGNIVFEKVCRFISENKLNELGVDYIEVNLSPIQCADERLADNYIAYMEKYHVSPSCINLEITESATIRRRDIVMKNILRLIDYKISFSLDDFGTGHSNLNYIVDMPVDIVKFDRGMTNAFFVDAKAHYVVEAAMDMIHGLGLKIVSEGIETKRQFETIRDMGISYIQGFYFSKPLPEKEFCEFVRQNNF